MYVNSSFFVESYLDPLLFSNKSSILNCYIYGTSSIIYLSFLITNICVLLPLGIFILYHGYQQWQQKRRSSSAATMTHSDCFTYHLVFMELIGLSGCAVCFCGIYREDKNMIVVGWYIFDFVWCAQSSFHLLTCVDRYLAVVHPITYLKLRNERGVRIRNICIGCVWLLCFVVVGLEDLEMFSVMIISLLVSFLTVVIFCSLSVLSVLVTPGPGEQGKGRERVDQSKQRAFNTILVILGVLVMRFTFNLVWEFLYTSNGIKDCVIVTCCDWFNLPCSLVLPLLFLHKAGKCVCRRTDSN